MADEFPQYPQRITSVVNTTDATTWTTAITFTPTATIGRSVFTFKYRTHACDSGTPDLGVSEKQCAFYMGAGPTMTLMGAAAVILSATTAGLNTLDIQCIASGASVIVQVKGKAATTVLHRVWLEVFQTFA